MAKNTITFPIVKGEGVRRNAETGIEIVTLDFLGKPTGDYEVRVPALNDYGYRIIRNVGSLAAARELATARVEVAREAFAQAFSDAISEHAERILAKHAQRVGDDLAHARRMFPSVFAITDEQERTDAAVAAATAPALDRVELIEFGTAEPSGYVYMLSARPGHAVCLPTMPKMEIVKRPRERVGRNGFRLAGWSVKINDYEIDRLGTKRDARVQLDKWLAEHLAKLGA